MGWKSALIWELDCLCNNLLCYSLAGTAANINFLLSLLDGPRTSIKVNPSKLCSIINLSSQMKWVQLGIEVQNCYKKKKKSSEGQKQSVYTLWSGVASCQSPPQNRSSLATVFLGLAWQWQYIRSWPSRYFTFSYLQGRILGVVWSYLCRLSHISFLPSTHRIFNVIIPAWALGNQKKIIKSLVIGWQNPQHI